jgi:hypothetical protein
MDNSSVKNRHGSDGGIMRFTGKIALIRRRQQRHRAGAALNGMRRRGNA